MALCESFNQRIRGKRQCRIVILISANISGAGGTNRKALKPSRAITKDPGPDANIFKLLMLTHDRAYLSMDSEKVYVRDNEM